MEYQVKYFAQKKDQKNVKSGDLCSCVANWNVFMH